MLLACSAGQVTAQPLQIPVAPADSARLLWRRHQLAEVRVRAIGPSRFAIGSRHYTADSVTLSQYRNGTVAELLQERTPLYIKSYGPGQLASITIRGTSAQHTAVLWNGLNITLPTLGQNDFALLPVGANTGLAIQPGPAAALYGSGAIGGVVLLNTTPDWQLGTHGSVQADGGSFGLRGGSVDVATASMGVAVRVAASYRQAENNYPYATQEFGGPVRHLLTGAALRHQWSLAPEVAVRLGTAGQLTASAWLTDTDRDVAPATTVDRHARQYDQSRRLLLAYHHQASARAQWTVRGAWFEDVLNYHDDGLISDSRVRTTQAQAEYTAAVGPRGSLRLGAEVQHFNAAFNQYVSPVTTENRAAAFALFRYDPRSNLRLTANLRQAALPQARPLTPTLALEWDLWTSGPAADSLNRAPAATQVLTLKASAARSYRASSLNERYYSPGGNPNLRPEIGLGYEAGLLHRLQIASRATLQTELTSYRQLVDNWVQWTPGAEGWRPRNLRQVLTQGTELSSALTLRHGQHRLTARAAYGFTQARTSQPTDDDQVPAGQPLAYVPAHTGAVGLDYAWRGWRVGASSSASSYRYTDATARAYLPGYGLLGGNVSYTLHPAEKAEILLLLQATNLFNHAYESYEGRPAPPRAIVVSLRVGWL